ncbi:hypothetical protein BAE44_0012704 [Dichanthelium oligosanthes]|uniref:Uncharacterized protein n=1 Tax=Dichanthelium oligosanthes TaxID=888268 RepID=A0A1E5VMD6_9POAL|nr:hypothetical protein BAE44_0012704 [Dichanthelium oligosanthes]
MVEVAVSPMVPDSNGADAVNVIPSVSVEETEQINGDVATMITTIAGVDNDDDEEGLKFNNVESTKDGDHGTTTMECATPVCRSPSTRKKRGAFSLFRAMFMSFSGSDSMKKTDGTTGPKKKLAVAAAADDKQPDGDSPSWTSLVDGVRPLRLRGQDLKYYPPPPPPPLGHADVYHDVLLPPPSPARSGFGFEEVMGMTSRYASAQDLHQMDSGEEEDAPAAEGGDDGGCCANAIDMQAEEFIAKFYEQFNSESFNGHAADAE